MMNVAAVATDGRRLGTVESLENKLRIVRMIPVYPEVRSVRSVIHGFREEYLASINMLAEDGGMICFLSRADKMSEIRRFSGLLKTFSLENRNK